MLLQKILPPFFRNCDFWYSNNSWFTIFSTHYDCVLPAAHDTSVTLLFSEIGKKDIRTFIHIYCIFLKVAFAVTFKHSPLFCFKCALIEKNIYWLPSPRLIPIIIHARIKLHCLLAAPVMKILYSKKSVEKVCVNHSAISWGWISVTILSSRVEAQHFPENRSSHSNFFAFHPVGGQGRWFFYSSFFSW